MIQFDLELQRGFEIAGIMLAMIAVLSGVFKVYTKIERLEVTIAQIKERLDWVIRHIDGQDPFHAPPT